MQLAKFSIQYFSEEDLRDPSFPMSNPCKHPEVRIVSRHDDAEFVECMGCGEIFDADEFRDMEIEEKANSKGDDLGGDDLEPQDQPVDDQEADAPQSKQGG